MTMQIADLRRINLKRNIEVGRCLNDLMREKPSAQEYLWAGIGFACLVGVFLILIIAILQTPGVLK